MKEIKEQIQIEFFLINNDSENIIDIVLSLYSNLESDPYLNMKKI